MGLDTPMLFFYHCKPWTTFALWGLLAALMLSGCANGPSGLSAPVEEIGATRDAGSAVATLLAKVETQEQQAHWERAAALLERALRIEPRNALLWHRLAKIRLYQGRYAMAQSLAQKSNALAEGNAALRQRNTELIEAARRSLTAG
jgi:tetratricopeptide (TPR) repeat protein